MRKLSLIINGVSDKTSVEITINNSQVVVNCEGIEEVPCFKEFRKAPMRMAVRTVVKNTLAKGPQPTSVIESALKENNILVDGYMWQRAAKQVADCAKGGPEGKGEQFIWWLKEVPDVF